MPYEIDPNNRKCVRKADSKKRVGCTKGSVKKYLGALHANVHESKNIINLSEGIVRKFNVGDEVIVNGNYPIDNTLENLHNFDNEIGIILDSDVAPGLPFSLGGECIISFYSWHNPEHAGDDFLGEKCLKG